MMMKREEMIVKCSAEPYSEMQARICDFHKPLLWKTERSLSCYTHNFPFFFKGMRGLGTVRLEMYCTSKKWRRLALLKGKE